MKDILLITHFNTLPMEKGNGRFTYLAQLLCERGHGVETVTSDFMHMDKKFRSYSQEELDALPYKVTFVHESGYKKNVCLKRLSSHKKFAKNLAAYLKTRKKPDVVYCSMPSLDAAVVAAEYCKANGVKFIIDVQDLWPEAFQMVLNIPVLSTLLFAPMKKKADKAYAAADEIIAVSQTYADRAMRVNGKCKKAHVVYLGTDRERFDEFASADISEVKAEAVKRIAETLSTDGCDRKIRPSYVGTLGSSYDLDTVFAAMKKLDKSVLDKIEFIIMGDGPKRAELEAEAKDLPVIFTGNLEYRDMVWLLSRCDIAVNPIVRGAAQSVINKHMDYAMAGLPVISTQESEEYRSLIDGFGCGVNCKCEDADDVAAALTELVNDPEKTQTMGENSRRMGEELFDRQTAYGKIAEIIEDIEEQK